MHRRERRGAVGGGAAGGHARPRPTMVRWRSRDRAGLAEAWCDELQMLQRERWGPRA